MAHPITFKPAPVDPHTELMRRLQAAPRQHAEALLVAYELLQTAHDQGILDAVDGLISAKDTIAGKLAEYARLPEGINGIRNLLEMLKIFTAVDPEMLDKLSRAVTAAAAQHEQELTPPGIFTLIRRATSDDSRRAFSFMTLLLGGVGKALKK